MKSKFIHLSMRRELKAPWCACVIHQVNAGLVMIDSHSEHTNLMASSLVEAHRQRMYAGTAAVIIS